MAKHNRVDRVKNPDVGGTWFENSYPDLRVDIPNHFYSYSFEPNPDWPDYFSRGPQIREYARHCADKYGVSEHVRFGCEVLHTRWDEAASQWEVDVQDGEGRTETLKAHFVISAVGMLNRPQIPDINGLESFEGPCFHSSRWQSELNLSGKRVGVIGTGASAMQFVPRVAEQASALSIFQRAAHWATFNPSYRAQISDSFKWLLRHVPYYHAWYRFLLFWAGCDRAYPVFCIDPEWEHQDRSISQANDLFRQGATMYIEQALGGDADLIEKCVPRYPPLGKRPLLDNGWYETLRKDHVSLVTDPIREVDAKGITTQSGERHELDVLILGTGFHAGRFLYPMKITGRGGVQLEERWDGGENPRAYLGITMPDFPNLFCLYGPNTNPVLGSVIYMHECQMTYVMDCIRSMLEQGHRVLDCRPEAHDAYNERMDEALKTLVWSHPRVRSYYNNKEGRVTTNAPWRMIEYWQMTRKAELSDYRLA